MSIVKKTFMTYIVPVFLTLLAVYSLGVNFSPAPAYKQIAPVGWVSIGLLMVILFFKNPNSRTEEARSFPLWRKIIGGCLIGGLCCYLAQFIVVFGFGDVVTKQIGTPFQETGVVVQKVSKKMCSRGIRIDGFQSALDCVCFDGFASSYKESWTGLKKGDEVVLIGKQSRFGRSVTDIQFVKQSSSLLNNL